MTATYDVPNVVQTIRTGAALTQRALAQQAHLSTLYVIRAEQSLPVALSLDLATALSNISQELTIDKIERQYEYDRKQMLRHYRKYVNDSPSHEYYVETAIGFALDNFSPVGFSDSHPFFLFRTKLCSLYSLPTSAIKFATMFGVHPAIISTLESRKDTLMLGSQLDVCLRETIGVNAVQLEMLRIACDRSL